MTAYRISGPGVRDVSDDDLIDELRKAASIWFRNSHLLALEELIRRFGLRKALPDKGGDDARPN